MKYLAFFIAADSRNPLRPKQKLKGASVWKIVNKEQQPLENATAELLRSKDQFLWLKQRCLIKPVLLSLKTCSRDLISSALHWSITSRLFFCGDNNYCRWASAIRTGCCAGAGSRAIKRDWGNGCEETILQRLSDRIIVNVENSVINAGSTALDVLERSPGIVVDQKW